jgi:hypothetical protein
LIILSIIILLPCFVYADELVVSTNKPSYSLGATINVYGVLTLTGAPVTDGLVAIQVDDSLGNVRLIRVVPTGTLPPPWKVRLTQFLSCDPQGNPKSSFSCGSLAFFRVTVESLDTILERQVTVAFNLFDWVGVSIAVAYASFSLPAGKPMPYLTSLPIPGDAFVGKGMCCLSVLTKWPKDGGQPYCPESSVEIEITGETSGVAGSPPESAASSPGSCNLSFKLPSNAMLGDYAVFASARYNAWASIKFDYFWRYTDINRDGDVSILDIAIVAKAYGSYPTHHGWNPKADLDGNNKVDILDIAAVAKDYGKKRT